jgi:hypothetical protein
MQSEPSKVSQNDSLASIQNPTTPNQHGLSDEHDESSATLLHREDVARTSGAPIESDAASVSSEGSRRGRDIYPGRLNSSSSSSSSSSQRSSPVTRVEEYERQQTYSRGTSDRITFQVIPSPAGSRSRVSIEEFPNGTITRYNLTTENILLMLNRGLDAHLVPFASADNICNEPCL